jgi:ubiquinone/menaquinone biosynthesis C-methylase UbiE
MVCHGGFSLDVATRRSWYNPDLILKDLQAGMTFADIGCGEGYFTILAAKKVGAKGKIYAVDIDPDSVAKLQKKAQAEGLTNITAKVGKAEEIVFCKACADWVFFSMDLHDFNDAAKVLRNAREMVSPQGVVVDLDWKKIDMQFGPPAKIRFSQDYAAGLMREAGLTVANVADAGPFHYVITAKPL